MLESVARSARERISAALALAAVGAIVAAFAVEVGPAVWFRWRLRGLWGDAGAQRVTVRGLLGEDPRTLRARASTLVPALEPWLAERLGNQRAQRRAERILSHLGTDDPAFLLRLRESPALWPAAYHAILGLEAASLLPEDACGATLDRSEERAGVNLFWGTQDRRWGAWTLGLRAGASDALALEPLESAKIADLGERSLEGVEATAADDPRLGPIAPCRPGHAYLVVSAPRGVTEQFAVGVRDHVPGTSARIAWRVLRVTLAQSPQ
jgi:hypothetical protein